MSPARRRVAVAMLCDRLGVSERRACRIVGQHRATQRRTPARPGQDQALRAELRAVSARKPRWGYRRAHGHLQGQGWVANVARGVSVTRSKITRPGERPIRTGLPQVRPPSVEAVATMDARGLATCALQAPIALAQTLITTHGAIAGKRIEAVLGRARRVARESGALAFEPLIDRELATLGRAHADLLVVHEDPRRLELELELYLRAQTAPLA